MVEYKLLSYILRADTPMYGGGSALRLEREKQIGNGDACNLTTINLPAHCGTHVDAPRHFYDQGRHIAQYSIKELIFERPLVVECSKNPGQFIMPEDLGDPHGCDLLLFRTGFGSCRGQDVYWQKNPGIAPETAEVIRRDYPGIRAVGLDAISVSSFADRSAGRRTHQLFLSDRGFASGPVLLIEDMDLRSSLNGLTRVFIAPCLVEGAEGAPCTVIGEFNKAGVA